MAVPFGFSIGDFLAVGKLIGQVAIELHESGEASPEYQSLLIELEALKRALCQLQTLRPAKNELLQLTSIRATALACQKPLQNFLDKISKFESRLGTFNTANNRWNKRWKDLPRKMQFRTMFKEDVKQLRSVLASHVATINLLLLTQAVASISAAEDDRDRFASYLESKILCHRQLLEDVNGRVDISLERQQEIKTQLRDQSSVLDVLGKKADETRQQLSGQDASIREIQSIANHTQDQTKSTLATATEVLARVTSGLMHLRQITEQLRMMMRLCTTFTAEMRAAMSKLMELFLNLQTTLQQINRNLSTRLYLPTVQFTTALGETMALPYQLCQQWATFKALLGVIFQDKPGKARVDIGKYLIMNARGGRLLAQSSWQHAVKQGDHLSMSIVLDELAARAGSCPFPSCQASTEGVEVENGGRTCRKCGRWSLLTLPDESNSHIKLRRQRAPVDEEDTNNRLEEEDQFIEDREDIELYRQIQVFHMSTGMEDSAEEHDERIENAVIGSPDAPWLQLTQYELAKLRKRMKKNATWVPSETQIARELKALGRGPDAYFREAKKKAEYEGKVFEPPIPAPVIDDESGTQHLPAGAISLDSLAAEEVPVTNRGMKLNEAKRKKREALAKLAAEEAEESARKMAEAAKLFLGVEPESESR